MPIGDLEVFLGVGGGKWGGGGYINYKLYMVSCDFILIKDLISIWYENKQPFFIGNFFSKFIIEK